MELQEMQYGIYTDPDCTPPFFQFLLNVVTEQCREWGVRISGCWAVCRASGFASPGSANQQILSPPACSLPYLWKDLFSPNTQKDQEERNSTEENTHRSHRAPTLHWNIRKFSWAGRVLAFSSFWRRKLPRQQQRCWQEKMFIQSLGKMLKSVEDNSWNACFSTVKHKWHLLLVLQKRNAEDDILITFTLGKFQWLSGVLFQGNVPWFYNDWGFQ